MKQTSESLLQRRPPKPLVIYLVFFCFHKFYGIKIFAEKKLKARHGPYLYEGYKLGSTPRPGQNKYFSKYQIMAKPANPAKSTKPAKPAETVPEAVPEAVPEMNTTDEIMAEADFMTEADLSEADPSEVTVPCKNLTKGRK